MFSPKNEYGNDFFSSVIGMRLLSRAARTNCVFRFAKSYDMIALGNHSHSLNSSLYGLFSAILAPFFGAKWHIFLWIFPVDMIFSIKIVSTSA
ncbi:MAG: hypothetical protein IKI03_07265 [Clostridia bacterium]|nr:hypothetical protein [Clostridia bacterium]